ncbi:MAG: hypothetical protein Q4F96_03740 [Bacillota bacterium]|nr:hypothetical protein [Bacillota bacterium]
MNGMIEKLKKRIRSRAGETIAETLVALLIAALALTMLAGAVSAASNMIRDSRTALNNYYSKTENVAAFNSAVTQFQGISVTGKNGSTMARKSYDILYVNNDAFAGTPVYAYKKK